MSYDIELVIADPQPALVVETRCDASEFSAVLASSFGKIFQHLAGSNQHPHGMPFMRYLEMTETSFLIQAGIPSDQAGKGEIQSIELPGGRLATTLFLGPYDEVGVAWDALHSWARERHLDLMGGWDVYENDPDTVSDPSELRTRLYLPADQGSASRS
ncbi:MAG: GyrI-like domain-containing protein [bacterium]